MIDRYLRLKCIYGWSYWKTGGTMELRRDSVYLYDFTSYDQFVIDLEIIAQLTQIMMLQYFHVYQQDVGSRK